MVFLYIYLLLKKCILRCIIFKCSFNKFRFSCFILSLFISSFSVKAQVSSDFSASPTFGCAPLVVTFTDLSTGNPTAWNWNFGNSDTSSNQNPSTIYTLPGVYTVTLTVSDGLTSDTIIKTQYIVVEKKPIPQFTISNDTVCEGTNIIFTSTSVVNPGEWVWDFGDGTIDTTTNLIITHTYTNAGNYLVSLHVIDKNTCDSTITKPIYILKKPIANFKDSTHYRMCSFETVGFKDLSIGNIIGWDWDFGDTGAKFNLATGFKNPIYNYTASGTYHVKLVVTNANGCKDSITIDKIINLLGPTGTFTFTPNAGCLPQTVCFDVTSGNTDEYLWYPFGDPSVQIVSLGDTCYTYQDTDPFKYPCTPKLFLSKPVNGQPCGLPATNLSGSFNISTPLAVTINTPHVITVPEDSIVTIYPMHTGGRPPYTYNWSPNIGIDCNTCTSVNIIGTDSITYTLTVYDSAGCKASDRILILTTPCRVREKFIPNVFSPNGDGENDLFFISKICPVEKFLLQIYDRWGAFIFSTTEHKKNGWGDENAEWNNIGGWDGKTNDGKEASEGVYYFIVHIDSKIYKGFVHLVR